MLNVISQLFPQEGINYFYKEANKKEVEIAKNYKYQSIPRGSLLFYPQEPINKEELHIFESRVYGVLESNFKISNLSHSHEFDQYFLFGYAFLTFPYLQLGNSGKKCKRDHVLDIFMHPSKVISIEALITDNNLSCMDITEWKSHVNQDGAMIEKTTDIKKKFEEARKCLFLVG